MDMQEYATRGQILCDRHDSCSGCPGNDLSCYTIGINCGAPFNHKEPKAVYTYAWYSQYAEDEVCKFKMENGECPNVCPLHDVCRQITKYIRVQPSKRNFTTFMNKVFQPEYDIIAKSPKVERNAGILV